jgi:hypothetical protein
VHFAGVATREPLAHARELGKALESHGADARDAEADGQLGYTLPCLRGSRNRVASLAAE